MTVVQQPDSEVPLHLAPSDLGALVAKSRQCQVFELGADRVVKFYPIGTSEREVARQANMQRLIHEAGFSVPWVAPSLTRHLTDGRIGVIYARAHGQTLTDWMLSRPYAYRSIAATLAREHRNLHSGISLEVLPRQRDRLVRHLKKDVYLGPERKQLLLELLDRLPDGETLCHGDFCWGNLLISAEQTITLDWADVSTGAALCDVARTWVVIKFNNRTTSTLGRWFCNLLAKHYLAAYFASRTPPELFREWCLINAALRLRDLPDARERSVVLHYVDQELLALRTG